MNSETGKIHAVSYLGTLLGCVNPKQEETVEQVLERARKRHAEMQLDSEPPPGAVVPDAWPRFNVGDEVDPFKGWWFRITGVDVETQEIRIEPHRRACTGKRGSSGTKARRRRRGRR